MDTSLRFEDGIDKIATKTFKILNFFYLEIRNTLNINTQKNWLFETFGPIWNPKNIEFYHKWIKNLHSRFLYRRSCSKFLEINILE